MPGVSVDVEQGQVSELAIVDTFTKLILGDVDSHDARDLAIIEALRLADISVLNDGYHQMGAYLRAMGVSEMITLVPRVRAQLLRSAEVAPFKEARGNNKAGSRPAMR